MKNLTTTLVVLLFAVLATNSFAQIRLDSFVVTTYYSENFSFTYDDQDRLKTFNSGDTGGATVFYDDENRVDTIKHYNPFLLDTVTFEKYTYSDEGLLVEIKETSDLGGGLLVQASNYFYQDGLLDEIHMSFGDDVYSEVWRIIKYEYFDDGKIKSINEIDPEYNLPEFLSEFEYEDDRLKYNHYYSYGTTYNGTVVYIYDGANNVTSTKVGELVNGEVVEGETLSLYYYDNFTSMEETFHPLYFFEEREFSIEKDELLPHFTALKNDRILKIQDLPLGYESEKTTIFHYSGITSTKSYEPVSKIQVHPNPTAETIQINLDDIAEIASIYNMNGQLVREVKDTNQIDVNMLPSGTYTIIIETNNGNHFSTFIKK